MTTYLIHLYKGAALVGTLRFADQLARANAACAVAAAWARRADTWQFAIAGGAL